MPAKTRKDKQGSSLKLTASSNGHIDLDDYLTDKVYPALFDRLDSAFPDFRFERKGNAWVATSWPSDFPYTVEQKHRDRLMVYQDRPWWIKIHGHDGIRLLDLVNGGRKPRGEEFVESVRRLCQAAGVPYPERQQTKEQKEHARRLDARRAVLDDVISICESRLWSEWGVDALRYLRGSRGLTDEQICSLHAGLYPSIDSLSAQLRQHGHDDQAIQNADVRWDKIVGYIILPWRDDRGRMLTLYGRWPGDPPKGKPKTLALPGNGSKSSPYCLDHARRAGHRELIVVEGLIDAAVLQVRGETRAVASVAVQFSGEQLKTLVRCGIEKVFVVGDPDGGGDRGTVANVNALMSNGITAYVPPRLPDDVDPDQFVLERGMEAWNANIKQAVHGFRHIARLIVLKHGEREPGDDQWGDNVIRDARKFVETWKGEHLDMFRRHFWPTIAEATGSKVSDLCAGEQNESDRSTQSPESWDNPIPLGEVPEAEAFPLDVLPEPMANLVTEISWAMNCAPDLAGVALLALAGGAIANARHLAITETHVVSPCLYAVVVAPPGMAKSPPLRLLRRPFDLHESEHRREWKGELERWKTAEDKANRGPKPTLKRCQVSNTTTESLKILLDENPRGLLMIRNELSGLIAGLNQYKSGGDDRQFYLDLWDGTPIIDDRKSDRTRDGAPVFVLDAFCTIYGTIQPDIIARMRHDPGRRRSAINDGFLDRFLFSFPADRRAVGEQWRSVSSKARAAWDDAVRELISLKMRDESGKPPRPVQLKLDKEGRSAWQRFTEKIANEMNAESFPPHLRGPWAKLRSYGARLALILRCLRWACCKQTARCDDLSEVDGDSMEAAERLIHYFESHARKVYAALDADPRHREGKRVIRWLANSLNSLKSLKGFRVVSKSELHAGVWGGSKDVDEASDIIALLVRYGWLRPVIEEDRKGPGRKPSPQYEVHPCTFKTLSENSDNSDYRPEPGRTRPG